MENPKTLRCKIREIKKLKALYREWISLFLKVVALKKKDIQKEAHEKAAQKLQATLFESRQRCIGRPTDPRLHHNDLHEGNTVRLLNDDYERRHAERFYRELDPEYAEAVDQKEAGLTRILRDCEKSVLNLQGELGKYPRKENILFEPTDWVRKRWRSIEKRWMVGELTRSLEILEDIQYVLEGQLYQDGKYLNKSPKTPITLSCFMENHCVCGEYTGINSKANLLHRRFREKRLKAPPLAAKYKKGQSKVYFAEDLIKKWPAYMKVIPSLPPLKTHN